MRAPTKRQHAEVSVVAAANGRTNGGQLAAGGFISLRVCLEKVAQIDVFFSINYDKSTCLFSAN